MVSKSILIFGGSGFVGGVLAFIAHQNDWNVYIATRFVKPGLSFASWETVDITDGLRVEQVISDVDPDVVVNLAAMADIDQVEGDREQAWKVNVEGAKNIVLACARHNIRHIYFSSGAVFDGKASIYAESAQPNPLNYYGHTKAEAEGTVLEHYPDSVVVRISLVLGFPIVSGNSFFASLETKLNRKKVILAPQDELRTPIDVITLSECVLELADNNFSGLLHLGGTEPIDRYTLTRKIVRKMAFDEEFVKLPADQKPDPGRAPRHRNGILDVSKAQALLETELLSVDDSIQRAFEERISPMEA